MQIILGCLAYAVIVAVALLPIALVGIAMKRYLHVKGDASVLAGTCFQALMFAIFIQYPYYIQGYSEITSANYSSIPRTGLGLTSITGITTFAYLFSEPLAALVWLGTGLMVISIVASKADEPTLLTLKMSLVLYYAISIYESHKYYIINSILE